MRVCVHIWIYIKKNEYKNLFIYIYIYVKELSQPNNLSY